MLGKLRANDKHICKIYSKIAQHPKCVVNHKLQVYNIPYANS